MIALPREVDFDGEGCIACATTSCRSNRLGRLVDSVSRVVNDPPWERMARRLREGGNGCEPLTSSRRRKAYDALTVSGIPLVPPGRVSIGRRRPVYGVRANSRSLASPPADPQQHPPRGFFPAP